VEWEKRQLKQQHADGITRETKKERRGRLSSRPASELDNLPVHNLPSGMMIDVCFEANYRWQLA